MRWLIVVMVLVLSVGLVVYRVDAAVTQVNTLASNYALLLANPSSANCVTTTNVTCDESMWAVKTEVAPYLGDNVYSYASDPSLIQSGNANTGTQLAMSWYGVTSLGPGTWYLQSLGQTNTMAIYIVPYINETQPSTNSSDRISYTMTTSRVWYDINITSAVTKSFNALGYVKLRIASQSGSKQADEFFLIVPPGAATTSGVTSSYFQIIPQGPVQTQMDQVTENEWNIVELSSLINSTISNASCVIKTMNGTQMNYTVNVSIESSTTEGYHMAAIWTPTIAGGFVEGMNYEVVCQFTVLGSTISGLEQYVYVNPHQTIMLRLSQFVTSIANIFGLLQSPVKVTQITQTAAASGATTVVSSVYKGSTAYSGANCTMSLVDSMGTQYADHTQMSTFGVSSLGLYSLSFNASIAAGPPWTVTTFCAVNDSAGSNVTYVAVGTIVAAPVQTVGQIFEGTPRITLISQDFYGGQSANIVTQLLVGSNAVTDAQCNLTVYYPNMTKILNAVTMSYSGDDGLYNYSWVPSMVSAGLPMRVVCAGGSLGTMVAQHVASLTVNDGVRMQMVT